MQEEPGKKFADYTYLPGIYGIFVILQSGTSEERDLPSHKILEAKAARTYEQKGIVNINCVMGSIWREYMWD